MATKGRKPLPTALKVLEGDRGKGRRPINKEEPTPPQENVKCPEWLMPEAKKEWKRLAPSLIAMGILTEHDMEAFAGYCQAYARWREAEEFLSQHGTIFKTPSGYVQQVPQAWVNSTSSAVWMVIAQQATNPLVYIVQVLQTSKLKLTVISHF